MVLRFTDILTNASAIADYIGERDVTAAHMLDAIAVLLGEKTIEDFGQPVSPMMLRFRGKAGADPEVRELAQRWFAELGGTVEGEVDEAQLEILVVELQEIATRRASES